MSTTKGFNLVIAASAEELGNYIVTNNLGEITNLEELIRNHADAASADAMQTGRIASELVVKLRTEGKGEWYFLLSKPDVWQPGTGKSSHSIATDAIAASRVPTEVQFLANKVVVITGNEGVVVREVKPVAPNVRGFHLVVAPTMEAVATVVEGKGYTSVTSFADIAAQLRDRVKTDGVAVITDFLDELTSDKAYFIVLPEVEYGVDAPAMPILGNAVAYVDTPEVALFMITSATIAYPDGKVVEWDRSKDAPPAAVGGTFMQRFLTKSDEELREFRDIRLTNAKVELALGNLKEGDLFSVNETGFQAVTDFNLWAAAHDYATLEGLDESLEFIDYLDLFSLAEGADSGPAGQVMFDAWSALPEEVQLQRSFDLDDTVSRMMPEAIKRFVEVTGFTEIKVPAPIVFNIATNLEMELQTFDGSTVTVLQDLERASQFPTPETIGFELIELNNAVLTVLQNRRIAELKDGEAVIVVGGYAYKGHALLTAGTVGVAKKFGFEAFILAPLNRETMTNLLSDWVTAATQEGADPLAVVMPEATIGADGVGLRLRAIEADFDTLRVANVIGNAMQKPDKVYQVLVADKNNLLPDEEGYDAEFIQPVYLDVKNQTIN